MPKSPIIDNPNFWPLPDTLHNPKDPYGDMIFDNPILSLTNRTAYLLAHLVGGPIVPGTAVYQVPLWNPVGAAWVPTQLSLDMILPAFAVTSFANGSAPEVGQSIALPAFTAAYSTLPTSAVLTDNAGTAPQTLVTPFAVFASTGTFVRNTYGASYTFTLTAHSGAFPAVSTKTITWLQKTFWGAATPAAYNEAFIEGLASSGLASAVGTTFTVNAGAGERIYYAFRSAYGTPSFWVGGFEGGFSKVATVAVTNAHGFTENYDLWASDNVALGSTTVTVT